METRTRRARVEARPHELLGLRRGPRWAAWGIAFGCVLACDVGLDGYTGGSTPGPDVSGPEAGATEGGPSDGATDSPGDATPSSPGTISCGGVVCAAQTTACCRTECGTGASVCVAPSSTFSCPSSCQAYRGCDDAQDCPGAQVCCATYNSGAGFEYSTCMALSDCKAMGRHLVFCDPAAPSPCPPGIACVPSDAEDATATCSGL